jgi:Restriction endonuclease
MEINMNTSVHDSDRSLPRTGAERDQVTLRAATVDVSRTDYLERVPVRFELTPREYEDGVVEMLEEKFSGHASVERDVRLPSRSGVRQRQVDILVRIHLPGVTDKLMVVDPKRYGAKVDVDDVESFIGMVEDVGAPLGMLVTTEGVHRWCDSASGSCARHRCPGDSGR